MQKFTILLIVSLAAILSLDAGAALFGKKDVDEQRAEVIEMRGEVLSQLYSEKPSAQTSIANAEGYAVFSNRGINVLLLSTANGKGIAHDNGSGADTYMKMFSVGGGLGMGVKKFSAVFIFHERKAFEQFVDKGWNFSGQADAAATIDADESGPGGAIDTAVSLNEDVTVYQMTNKGFALQVTLQGTKYWKNDDLN